MKKFLALLLFAVSTASFAEMCTYVIRDNYGYEYQNFTRDSYTHSAACSFAEYDCKRALSEGQSVGRYYNAICMEKYWGPTYPQPYPPSYPQPYPQPYPREPQYPREPHYPREPQYPREPREPRYPHDPRDPREPRFPREPHRDPREPQFPRGPEMPTEPRDPRWPREPRGPEPREPQFPRR